MHNQSWIFPPFRRHIRSERWEYSLKVLIGFSSCLKSLSASSNENSKELSNTIFLIKKSAEET